MQKYRPFKTQRGSKTRFRDDIRNNIKAIVWVGFLVLSIIVYTNYLSFRRQPTEIIGEKIAIVEELIPGSLAGETRPASSAALIRFDDGRVVKATMTSGYGLSPKDSVKVRIYKRRDGSDFYRIISKIEN